MLIGKIQIVNMTPETERHIMIEMSKIGKIRDFWELHRIAGYTLYGKTKDERYLGYVDFAATMIAHLDKLNEKDEEDEPISHGYESVV